LPARRIVLAWENFGPTHEDRLAACAADPELAVRGVQFFSSSEVYAWDAASGHAAPTLTLFGEGERAGGLRLAWRLFRAARPGTDAVYLCHYERWPVLLAAIMLRLAGIPVFTMLDSKFDDYPRNVVREFGKSLYLLPYRGAIVAGRRSRDYLRFLGFGKRPVVTGFDGLSVARIRAQAAAEPAPAGIPHGARDFVIVARLVAKKNIVLALRAYARWRESAAHPRKLRILGGGPLESELRGEAQALGLADDVVFEGNVQTARVSAVLSEALCLILPSTEEQFGLVVTEAMAMGVPPLVSSNAGACDVLLVNGVNGWLIDPYDPAALVRAMGELDRDEPRWRAMCEAALADSERGDARHFAEAVRRLAR
jgi:glycosyltransferase involved in cell wall biosynthesis